MSDKTVHFFQKNQQGLTLIELIAVIVVLGFVASIGVAAFSAMRGIGWETQTTTDSQMAQQRLELILNEKRKVGFPEEGIDCQNGSGLEAEGPDPCCLYGLSSDDFPGCTGAINVVFESNNNEDNACLQDNGFEHCNVTVDINGEQNFTMRVYND